jgi:membrane-associated phospholipid phosphatase
LLALALLAGTGRPAPGAEQRKKALILPESDGFRLSLTAADRNDFGRLQFAMPDLSGMLQTVSDQPESSRPRTITPFTDLFRNAGAVYSGANAWFHIGAAAGTLLIIQSGLDSKVHNYFVRNTGFEKYSQTAVHLGSRLPALLSAGLLGWGLVSKSSRTIAAGSAVTQAFLLAVATTGVLKGLTGRPNPDPVIYDDNRASATFRFGILRGGVFHGWPSGHMLSNTAAVTSLLCFFNRSTALHVAGGAYLGYLFLSIASHGRGTMHWFSDTVAGALMGFAIGSTVGTRFRRLWESKMGKTAGVTVQTGPESFTLSFGVSL